MLRFAFTQVPESQVIILPLREISPEATIEASVVEQTGMSQELLQNAFKGKAKEICPLLQPARQWYLVGLGKLDQSVAVADYLRNFFFQYGEKLPSKVTIDMRHLGDFGAHQTLIEEIIEGAKMGLYRPVKPLKSAEASSVKVEMVELCTGVKFAEGEQKKMISRGENFAEIKSDIIDLVNRPSNLKTPAALGDYVKEQGKKYAFDVQVLLDAELKKQGFHAILAIGQGSVHDSAFIQMRYQMDRTDLPLVGLVGKGVTFDTGGISIKPSDNMHFMKSDMGGAATMIGTMMAAAALRLPIRMVAVVAAAENMPDGNAVKPSDVISSFSGKTIEIIDTDAEGRVVLADALAWMVKEIKPDYLIDAATLTGSIIRAIGTKAAGLFTKNDALCDMLIKSGELTNERLWRMPMWDDYLDEIASDVADVRNFSGSPAAGSISAAKFLEAFTAEHPAWAHLDIAGMAFGANPYTKMKSGTGYGIKLLVHFIESLRQAK